MMTILARFYVISIFLLELLLLGAAVTVHIAVWLGKNQIREPLLVGGLLAGFATGFLAKDQNIWKNEFKSCPSWMRRAVIVLGLYGLVIAFFEIVALPSLRDPERMLAVSAMVLAFNALFLCIPYSVLWANPLQGAELVKKSLMSFVALVLGGVVILVRSGAHL